MRLNIFNQHCDRVHMANLAQTVNVLQSLILTDGSDFLLTPTYHVFDLYQVHQDATLLETMSEGNTIPETIKAVALEGLTVAGNQVTVTLPPMAVAAVAVTLDG